jgi:hypothetical protein
VTYLTITAAVIACIAAAIAITAYLRLRGTMRTLDEEIERGKARFDAVLAQESETRAAELEQNLALARSHALSVLAEEERRITDERRRDVAERERDATAKLASALTEAQRAVEQRFVDWGSDVTALQQGLTSELERIGQRQQQLVAGIEAKIDSATAQLESSLEEHRNRIVKMREDLDHDARDVATAFAAELEAHSAERRRALHEVAERLRRRERELQDQIDHEQAEATQRVALQLQDVERRQLEQLKRVLSRETQHAAEAAATQFDETIRVAREDAARRLARELELSVERFAREAEGAIAERVEIELRVVESRIAELNRRLESLSTRS